MENPSSYKSSLMPFLVILLIIAAFFIGSLYTKVQYLEKGGSSVLSAGTQTQLSPSPTPIPIITKVSDNEHIRGAKNAKISLIEYSDFECPFCKQFHPTMQELMKTYAGKINWVYRHYPLPFHANAEKEAEASECITELGGNDKFWDLADTIFERTTSNGYGFSLDKLGPLAAELGLDQAQFQACLDSGKYEKKAKENLSKLQLGTPTTYIMDQRRNTKQIEGAVPIDVFKTVIDQALAAK